MKIGGCQEIFRDVLKFGTGAKERLEKNGQLYHSQRNNLGGDRMATPCFIHAKADTYLSERWTRAHDYLIHRLRANGHIK